MEPGFGGPSQRYGVYERMNSQIALKITGWRVKNGYPQVLKIYEFLKQAENESKHTSRTPIVLYKGDYKRFVVIADAQDILPILAKDKDTWVI